MSGDAESPPIVGDEVSMAVDDDITMAPVTNAISTLSLDDVSMRGSVPDLGASASPSADIDAEPDASGTGAGSGSAESKRGETRSPMARFLHKHTCYDVLPSSNKVVVFEGQVPLRLAFYALVEHDIKVAPVYDNETHQFIAPMTMMDFIALMLGYFDQDKPEQAFSTHTCISWKRACSENDTSALKMIHLDPERSLHDAVSLLRHAFQVPILNAEEKTVLGILTLRTAFDFISGNMRGDPGAAFKRKVRDSGVGVYTRTCVVSGKLRLGEVLRVLLLSGLEAVVVEDADGKVIDVFHQGEISYLVRDSKLAKLGLPVSEVRALQATEDVTPYETLHTCGQADTLLDVFDFYATEPARTLVMVDDAGKYVGFLPLSVVLGALVRHEAS